VSTFTLTDAAIEQALAPGRFDIAPPRDFTDQIAAAIAKQPRRSSWWLLNPFAWPRMAPRMTQLLLVLLLILMLIVGAIGAASLVRRATANGDVIVATGTELLAIDPRTGVSHSLVASAADVFGVARSGDGQFISFWTDTGAGTTLELMDRSGSNRRIVAANVIPAPVSEGQIDVWSSDRRFLAAGVLVDGVGRILVVDVASGDGQLIGPSGAGNPLWSPDGHLLAFSYSPESHSVVAVMHPDGSGIRTISGDLGAFDAAGVNNWSPDGVWVYFGAERNNFQVSRIHRANVEGGYSEQLTDGVLSAAPALSPDGTTVAYSDWPGGRGTQNLMLMEADGANQRLLLASALNNGWSNDGEFLLAEWRPTGSAFELLVLRPDGTDRRTLMTFESGCAGACVQNLGWGQPRP
jgi:Tol biopolymer transport system component